MKSIRVTKDMRVDIAKQFSDSKFTPLIKPLLDKLRTEIIYLIDKKYSKIKIPASLDSYIKREVDTRIYIKNSDGRTDQLCYVFDKVHTEYRKSYNECIVSKKRYPVKRGEGYLNETINNKHKVYNLYKEANLQINKRQSFYAEIMNVISHINSTKTLLETFPEFTTYIQKNYNESSAIVPVAKIKEIRKELQDIKS